MGPKSNMKHANAAMVTEQGLLPEEQLPFALAHKEIRQSILQNKLLVDCLQSAQEKGACFLPNPGNLGDGLIALGTFDLFDALDLEFETVKNFSAAQLENRNFIILGGGGGWVEGIWEELARSIRPALEKGAEVIVLPCSINGAEQFFERYADQITIFVREQYSYERLSLVPALKNKVHRCHDLAFATHPDRFSDLVTSVGDGTLFAFRTDSESLGQSLPPGNVDIPSLWNGDHWYDTEQCLEPLRAAARLIAQFDKVETDRLHMTALSAMLGCNVDMYSNSYFKNKGVFDYSLHMFENVNFMPEQEKTGEGEGANTPHDKQNELESELTRLARLRREYFEPELERLQKSVANQEKEKSDWFAPELERLNKELSIAKENDPSQHLQQIKALQKQLNKTQRELKAAEQLQNEDLKPQISLLKNEISTGKRRQKKLDIEKTKLIDELEVEAAKENKKHLAKIKLLQSKLRKARKLLKDAEQKQADDQELGIIGPNAETQILRKDAILKELQEVRHRIGNQIERNSHLSRRINKLHDERDNLDEQIKGWFEPEVKRLIQCVADFEKTKMEWWDPQLSHKDKLISELTLRADNLEKFTNSRFYSLAIWYYGLHGKPIIGHVLRGLRRIYKFVS